MGSAVTDFLIIISVADFLSILLRKIGFLFMALLINALKSPNLNIQRLISPSVAQPINLSYSSTMNITPPATASIRAIASTILNDSLPMKFASRSLSMSKCLQNLFYIFRYIMYFFFRNLGAGWNIQYSFRIIWCLF